MQKKFIVLGLLIGAMVGSDIVAGGGKKSSMNPKRQARRVSSSIELGKDGLPMSGKEIKRSRVKAEDKRKGWAKSKKELAKAAARSSK